MLRTCCSSAVRHLPLDGAALVEPVGPLFAADIRRQRASRMRGFRQWRWHLDEAYVKINGEMHYLRRPQACRDRTQSAATPLVMRKTTPASLAVRTGMIGAGNDPSTPSSAVRDSLLFNCLDRPSARSVDNRCHCRLHSRRGRAVCPGRPYVGGVWPLVGFGSWGAAALTYCHYFRHPASRCQRVTRDLVEGVSLFGLLSLLGSRSRLSSCGRTGEVCRSGSGAHRHSFTF